MAVLDPVRPGRGGDAGGGGLPRAAPGKGGRRTERKTGNEEWKTPPAEWLLSWLLTALLGRGFRRRRRTGAAAALDREGTGSLHHPGGAGTGSSISFCPGPAGGKESGDPDQRDTELIWERKAYPNGSELPVTALVGSDIPVSFGNGYRLGNVSVMRGSKIPALFFTVTEED